VQIAQSCQKVCAHFATERNLPIAQLLILSDFNLFTFTFRLLNACAQLAAKTYSLDMPCSSPPIPSIKIRRNLCGYLTAGSFGHDLSYEAQKRYADTDARHFFALRALPTSLRSQFF
jgi:hypothetical protein